MKRVLLSCLLLLAAATTFAQKRTEKDLLGKWLDEKEPDNGLLITGKGKLNFWLKGQAFVPAFEYKAELDKTPAPMLITIRHGSQEFHLRTEMTFTNDSTLKWRIFPGDIPISFSDIADSTGTTTVTLKKVKQ